MNLQGPKPFISSSQTAPSYWQRGILWDVLMSADATAGEFTLLEQLMPEESGPPAHRHERASEGFYLLEGEVEYTIGELDDVRLARAGNAVWIPKGTKHAFRVVSRTARCLNFYTPGGFDDHLPYLAVPAASHSLPAKDVDAAVDPMRRHVNSEKNASYLNRLRDLQEETWEN